MKRKNSSPRSAIEQICQHVVPLSRVSLGNAITDVRVPMIVLRRQDKITESAISCHLALAALRPKMRIPRPHPCFLDDKSFTKSFTALPFGAKSVDLCLDPTGLRSLYVDELFNVE
jgi:hypothetical protein